MKTKKLLFLAVMGILILSCAGCGKKKVNLNKYLIVTESGYDGIGNVEYKFDKEAFIKDYSGKIKFNKKSDDISQLVIMSGVSYEEALVEFCVDCKTEDITYHVSNGDVINIVWDCKDVMAEDYFNCELEYSPVKYTVSKLTPLDDFDPFEHMEIKYKGTSGKGNLEAVFDESVPEMALMTVDFTKVNNEYLYYYYGNGDEVKVTVSCIEEFLAEEYGKKLSVKEKTFIADGFGEYVNDISQVSDDKYKEMDDNARSIFSEECKSWDSSERFNSMELVGNYVFSPKSEDEWPEGRLQDVSNAVYFVYKISMTNAENEEFTYYWYTFYRKVTVTKDGVCEYDLTNVGNPSGGSFFGVYGDAVKCDSSHYVIGFSDLASLHAKQLESFSSNEYNESTNIK